MVNPFDLSASDLLIWGIVLHLIADWPLQSEWMAKNKMRRRYSSKRVNRGEPSLLWWDRHPSGYVHAFVHGVLLAAIFWWAAIPLAIAHFLIDCRWIVEKWSLLVRQSQPQGNHVRVPIYNEFGYETHDYREFPIYDVGLEVRFWTDQVFHIVCIAVAALLVTL